MIRLAILAPTAILIAQFVASVRTGV